MQDQPTIFTGGATELSSPSLTITQVGDLVSITYVPSAEDVEPMLKFTNHSIDLAVSSQQIVVREAEDARRAVEHLKKDGK